MSRMRTSDTTGTPVRSAIQAACPSCSVPRACAPSTQWNTVWPCDTISSTSGTPATTAAATSANAWPISVSSSHTSARVVDAGGNAATSRARRSGRYGVLSVWSTTPLSSSPVSDRSTTAASIPSCDVPEIIPSTFIGSFLPAALA